MEKFEQLGQIMTAARTTEEMRTLLDKAIIGLGATVDLIERYRTNAMASYDPEAGAAKALDLVRITEGAARAERERIIAAIRTEADSVAYEPGQRRAILEVANEIEAGRL